MKSWLPHRRQAGYNQERSWERKKQEKSWPHSWIQEKKICITLTDGSFLADSVFVHYSFSPSLTQKYRCLAPAVFCVWYWGYRDYIVTLHKQEDDAFAVERIMTPAESYPKVLRDHCHCALSFSLCFPLECWFEEKRLEAFSFFILKFTFIILSFIRKLPRFCILSSYGSLIHYFPCWFLYP